MQLRELLSFLLNAVTHKRISCALILAIAFSAIILPNVRAQTTSVTSLRAPSQVALGYDDTASFDVTAQVSFAELLSIPYNTQQLKTFSSLDALEMAVFYFGQGVVPSGSANASPYACFNATKIGITPGKADCFTTPPMFGAETGTETVTFHVVLNNATPQAYHFDVGAVIVSVTANGNTPIYGSTSSSDFWVTVTPAQVNVSPTYTEQETVTSSVASNSDNSALISVGLVGLIVVVVAILIYNKRRTRQKPPETQTITQKQGESKVEEPKAETATSSKNFCIDCGSELPAKSKFCHKCGTKQP